MGEKNFCEMCHILENIPYMMVVRGNPPEGSFTTRYVPDWKILPQGRKPTMDAREKLRLLVATINASAWIPNNVGERLMAKQVTMAAGAKFEFKTGKVGGETKYAWDEWLNGDLLMIEQSIGRKDEKGTVVEVSEKRDYELDTDFMPPKLKTAARRRYRVVEISRKDADGNKLVQALIIRSRELTPDEKIAEDKLRAKEKVERKAKLAKEAAASNAVNGEQHAVSENPLGDNNVPDQPSEVTPAVSEEPKPAPRRRK